MKAPILAVAGIAAVLVAAGCSKKVVAAKPPDTTPAPQAQANTARPTPAPTKNPAPVKQQAAATPQQPRSTTIPPEVRRTLNEILARMEDALFDYDKSTIRSDATTALQDDSRVIRDILASYPSQKLVIEGHCDERGSNEYNVALGDRRARAAEEFLVSMGVSANQLSVISYGKERPVCTDKTEECWQKNRRAHLTAP
jgi:peptidoglycan-associated lipoprotein